MSFLQWRRFNFFDKDVVKDSENQPFEKLKNINISATTSGRGQIVIGDYDGNIHFLSRQLQLNTVKAYEIRVSHLYQLRQHNLLITSGEDEEGINPLIKVWNQDKVDKVGTPACCRIVRAIPNNVPSPVTAITVHENLNYMAVGFQNGSVLLFKGDVTRDRHSKQRIVYEGPDAITGLAFKLVQKTMVLFISTPNHTLSVTFNAKDKDTNVILDQHGCALRCSALTDTSFDNQFIIGRSEAVYFYQTEGRGPCLAFDGPKLQVHWHRGYLIVVSNESKSISRATAMIGNTTEMNIVTVYDIQNKFIAFSSPFPQVVDVICEWGAIYVLGGDHKMYQLEEKDTQTKLEMFFKKNLYVMAINLAQSQQYDQDGVIDIFRQYGDHLYSKGDHDGAILQYIKTIGKLEASYVIRKFLDAQRIHNLTAYLQELHKAQLATEDHTTLLLNCYTKLKDVSKLDQFIMTKDVEVNFNVETAIRVCRSAGYFTHALFLAERHKQHDWYLKIQLEDVKDYQQALIYIRKLDFSEAESNMKRYGKILMTNVPKETTDLLKSLCTDYKPSDQPLVDSPTLSGRPPVTNYSNSEDFIHIFVKNSSQLTEFLVHMIKVRPKSSAIVYNTVLELYLHTYVHEKDNGVKSRLEKSILDLLQNPQAGYDLDQALVLSQMNNFKPGILYLYEKAKLYLQILRHHMEQDEYNKIIETCKRFGDQDPHLWTQALSYFARKEENCKTQIVEVLTHIDKWNLLPPLQVVQTLAHNSTATLAVIKEYLIKRVQCESDQISEDDRLIKQYKEETQKIRCQIDELQTSAKVFQETKCCVCSHPLELPSVHFLCQHSYHLSCFESYSENDSDCPACLPENRKLLELIHAQQQNKDLHEQFHRQLDRSSDAFSVVADYFGRGVFNTTSMLMDTPKKPAPSSTSTNPFF